MLTVINKIPYNSTAQPRTDVSAW